MKKFFIWLSLLITTNASLLRAEVIEEEHPVVILGGGIAAMTAGTYLARGGIPPVILTGPVIGGMITQSHNVQNWPGEIAISGLGLSEKVKQQAESNGAVLLSESVTSVDFSKRPFTVTTRKVLGTSSVEQRYKAHTVIIALGAAPNLLNIPGEGEGIDGYWSRGVYNCAVCDGTLYKDKVVAVVGGGDGALIEAQYLSNIAKKVHIFVRRGEFRTVEKERMKEILARPNVEVHYHTTIKEIKGDGRKMTHLLVTSPCYLDEREVPIDALFLAIGSKPNTELFKGQLELDREGYIVLKKHQQTSVEGVYAVGDVADPDFKQAISAAGDAAKAALQIQKDLVAYIPSAKPGMKKKLFANEVVEVTSKQQFTKELQNSNGIVFVDFYSTHCGPCRMFSPLFETWAHTFGKEVKFLKVNADRVSELFETYQIFAVPTLLILDEKGNIIRRSSGIKEISEVGKRLEKAKGKDELTAQDLR